MLQPDYERFVSTTAAPFFEAGDAGPNARQNFFCARLVTDASMAARAAAWVDESPRRDATIVALVGAERVAYEGGDEVCVSYGLRTSAEYLEEYGFVPFFNGARLRGISSSPGEFGDGDLGEGLWASGQLAELTFALEEGVTRCHDDKADILEEAGLDVQATFEVSSSRAGEPAALELLRELGARREERVRPR